MVLQTICRRKSDPRAVQKLWAAITYIRSQKQISNFERLSRYVQREYEMGSTEMEKQLTLAIDDGLICSYTTKTWGSNSGMEQDGYRISPDEEEENRGEHDWYCYDCHKPGDVVKCGECWRVYHLNCTDAERSGDEFVCAVCRDIKKHPRMKRKELNLLLTFTIARLKERSKELHWFGGRDLGLDRFVFQYMDLNTMEEKTATRQYKYLEQFYSDARVILHNIFICYGDTGVIPDLARLMIRDCRHDLDEIRLCKDCYRHSNTRGPNWFCQPCDAAHELVYAKQKGFSYWPAKVIAISPEGYDVRFFGAQHQRAIIPSTSIKPIDTSTKDLGLKKSAGFNKAMEEITLHQTLLKEAANHSAALDSDDQSDEDVSPIKVKPSTKRKAKRKLSSLKDHKTNNDDDDVDDDDDEAADDYHDNDDYNDVEEPVRKKRKTQNGGSAKKKASAAAGNGAPTPASEKKTAGKSRSKVLNDTVHNDTPSSDKVRNSRSRTFTMSDVGIQTPKKMTEGGKRVHKASQTTIQGGGGDGKKKQWSELEAVKLAKEGTSGTSATSECGCGREEKYSRIFEETQERIERENQEEKEKALQELEERLRGDFDEDRQKAVSRAVSNVQREVERVRQQTEERCRDENEEEMKKLEQKYKEEISQTKKKQWCYNCEEEAMYHCCWNTSYCSVKCQQEHWHTEHKKLCRRKRN